MKANKYFILMILLSQFAIAQSIVIDTGSSIEVGAGSDVCAGVYGNITGNLFGGGTQCNQTMVTTFQLAVNVSNGWNMVSVPGLHPTDQNVNTWWQYRDPGANVYKYAGGYQAVTTLTPGTGYWMKHAGARTYNTGEEWPAGGIQVVPHNSISASAGWNLIGGYELSVTAANVTTNPPGLQSGFIYKYSVGYQTATTIDPGYGYWIKLTGAGQIIIPETLAKGEMQKDWFPENWGRIVFVDNVDHNYVLYTADDKTDLNFYELPPAPPSGMFDIRFESGRIAEDINSSIKSIILNGVEFPLTLKVENIDLRIQDEFGKNINSILKSGESLVINNPLINKLNISKNILPKEFALEQNYPNPFNPSTKIRFSIPNVGSGLAQTVLKVYDLLGNEVATLVNEEKPAGFYEVEFNASQLSSGIYFYKLSSGSFTETKKMTVLK